MVTFTRYRDLAVSKFIDQLHGPKKVAAKSDPSVTGKVGDAPCSHEFG
ncbi:MAG TPA: hypothetical protein VN969_04440 [Streptosporangiaceae bacterium]|nr:hypothetical protein [Streptosporangiaceae bacterium]